MGVILNLVWTALLSILPGLAALFPIIAAILLAILIIGVVIFSIIAAFNFSSSAEEDITSTEVSHVGDALPGSNGPITVGVNTISVNEAIALIGTHICDTGHHAEPKPEKRGCWNELHPVKGVTKIDDDDYPIGDLRQNYYFAALIDFINRTGQIQQVAFLEHKSIG